MAAEDDEWERILKMAEESPDGQLLHICPAVGAVVYGPTAFGRIPDIVLPDGTVLVNPRITSFSIGVSEEEGT